jgi:CRISPR-associated protein Cas1
VIKRTIEISRDSVHLAVQLDQLRLVRHEPECGLVSSIPCEDIGLLVIDQQDTTYSHAALARLLEFGAAVLICGRKHLPTGLLLPLADHTEVVWRIHEQFAVRKPIQKQLWKQLVVAKVRGQAANLDSASPARPRLLALARAVKSGDPTNIEAQAAKIYWGSWLGEGTPFRRDPEGDEPLNAFLNYGYAVLRAAVARALVSAGLHPSLGLHHCNRSNAFCLADDLLEPLRPLVDREVRLLHQQGHAELNRGVKAGLLGLLAATVRLDDQTGPLMVALHRTAASLVRCYRGEEKRLRLLVGLNGQGD